MDTGSDTSDGEHDFSVGAGAPITMETGAGLKPQMDSIFAELEKSLPSIDFDLSDMSSDTEEPIIFHRNLKMSELDYEDEKDLDTSLSGESTKDLFKSQQGLFYIPSVDKNIASVSNSPTMTFDNDLAVLLAAREGHKDDEDRVSSWKDLERIAQRDKQRQEEKEDTTAPSSHISDTQTNRQTETNHSNNTPHTNRPTESNTESLESSDSSSLGILEAGNLILAQLAENARGGSSVFGGRTADFVRNQTSTGTSTDTARGSSSELALNQNRTAAGRNKSNASVSTSNRESGGGEIDSNKEVERIMSSAVKSRERQEERLRKGREEQRRKQRDLARMYMSSKAPHLSMQILDSIDWDSPTLNDDVETTDWDPPPEVRARLHPLAASGRQPATLSLMSENVHGEGDGKTSSETENLTLIQKLARFSIQQSGTDSELNHIHPQTGASVEMIMPAKPSTSSSSSSSSTKTTERSSASGRQEKAKTSSGPSSDAAGVSADAEGQTSTHPPPPSAAMTAMLETLNKRTPEPETVYLDLRGFTQHQEEEKQHMASVSRVLGLPSQPSTSKDDDSSESEDEGKWLRQRQQIKRSLASRGTSTPSFKQQRLQPTRVIPLQNKTPQKSVSSRGVSTVSCGASASLSAPGHAGSGSQSSVRSTWTESDSNRQQEEEQAALLAREKEKERQKEVARLAREAKEKIRSARLRMLHHLEGLRSAAAVSENKPCAENTPVLFDLEASYEPRPPVLPTCLEGEEVLLITVNLSSNGEIALHNSRPSKTSTETVINALPKSYLSLVCWLVSLIPPDFSEVKQWLEQPEEIVNRYPPEFPPFHVIGLQQLLVDGGLCLAIAVCPSPVYMARKDERRDRMLKKGKKGEDTSLFYKFVDTFISRHSLSSIKSWPRYLGNDSTEEEDLSESFLLFTNPHLPFLGKPMSVYMQLHKDPRAVDKIFNKDVGFFWQTVDPQDSVYQHDWHNVGEENVPQNTLFLLSQQALFRPQVVYETLLRVISQSLDISGLRVLYPASEKATPQFTLNPNLSACPPAPERNPEGATPVLAVAVRGPHARVRLISIVGPTDYTIAKKTDPFSLTALFGRPDTGLQIFCPRNADRAHCELARWFGGRVTAEQGSVEVGLPYRLPEEDSVGAVAGSGSIPGAGKGRKGKKVAGGTVSLPDQSLEPKPLRPPATLTATTLGHVILVLSPIVPIRILGFLVSLMQQKAGFQPRGLRRLCLSVKKANSLGISSAAHSIFCPGVNLEVADIDSTKHQQESCSPCTVVLLERENASHHASSLAHILASELKNENILEWMEDRTETRFEALHLFHLADYSDTLLTSLGGHFSKCPSFDPMCDVRGPLPPLYSNKEMEQVVVLILLGKDLIKDWGSFLQKLQTFSTMGSRLSDFELLGAKWLSGMNSFQTREVTPYEIGDSRWRASIRFLANEPAVVLALRSVNAFKKLEPFVSLPVNTPTTTIPPAIRGTGSGGGGGGGDVPHPTRLMSRTPKDTYLLLRLFFWSRELYPDPDSRSLLPCLPESRLYCDALPWNELGNMEDSKSRILLKSIEAQDLTQENLPELLLCDVPPLTTFLLVKPRAVHKHLPKILRRVLHEGFSVVGMRLEVMDEGVARRFLAVGLENGGQVHDLHLQYLTSEPSLYLALWRENGVKKLRDLLGPEDPQQARRQSQFYWRGIYGSDLIHNGLYASRTYIESVWDLKVFFPDGLCCDPTFYLDLEQILCPAVDSTIDVQHSHTRHAVRRASQPSDTADLSAPISDTEQRVHSLLMQMTCLVLPPTLVDSQEDGTDAPFVDILALLISRGYELVGARMVWLTQQQAEQFLHVIHRGSFESVCQLTAAPCLVLALERDNAVLAFDNTLGSSSEAQTLLSKYGKDILRPSDIKQALQLLSLFFQRLTPASHVDILPLPPPPPPLPPPPPPGDRQPASSAALPPSL